MINTIKEKQLLARKNKDKFVTGILTALISEITIIGKNDGNRETTEQEAIKVIKKFKKNIQESLNVVKNEQKLQELNQELSIYDSFLPKQMSENETKVAVQAIISEIEKPNIGLIMKEMKQNYGDLLDMKIVNQIVNKELKG